VARISNQGERVGSSPNHYLGDHDCRVESDADCKRGIEAGRMMVMMTMRVAFVGRVVRTCVGRFVLPMMRVIASHLLAVVCQSHTPTLTPNAV
jgi:hypothetical protein